MSVYVCIFNKETLILKSHKKPPLMLRMIVLAFAAFCSFYICIICLKQIGIRTQLKLQNLDFTEPLTGVKQMEMPFRHYPKPTTFSRKECEGSPVHFFVILSMQRSGSGWFETLLNSHMNVSSNGEIFNVVDRRRNVSCILHTLDKVYNLDWFSSASRNECSAAAGFKWMLNQGVMKYHEEIAEYFKRRGVSVIFLLRRNLLRRMVSLMANSYDRYAKLLNGTHKSHVHSAEEANKLSEYKPRVNSTTLMTDLREAEATVAKAIEYFNSTRHIVLFYEDLMKDRTKLRDVIEFLQLPQMELRSRQVKIHTGPLSDTIKNWDDVNKALEGTTYESFLRADYR